MCCLCLLFLSQHNPGTDTPNVCMYYMFRPIVAIIRYIESLHNHLSICYMGEISE
jgi:hypothetical protein